MAAVQMSMSKQRNTKTTETLAQRIARIEREHDEFNARCDAIIKASSERDERVTKLMGW